MPFDYLSVIKPFAVTAFDPFQPLPSRWNLEPFRVARSLLRLLDNPDAIAQACFGTCGQAAFLRAWAYRDPEAVARFALDLFASGSARIGDYPIAASGDLLDSTWMKLPLVPDWNLYANGVWGVGNRITEAVWMIVGALVTTESGSWAHRTLGNRVPPLPYSAFDGSPASDLSTLTLPGELTRWLQKTGCYPGGVDDNTRVIGGRSLADDVAVTSAFDTSTDVFLCINANMLAAATLTPTQQVSAASAPLDWFPDHWVMLEKPIVLDAGTVTMNIWTWGGRYDARLSLGAFNDTYYGSVVARAGARRRTPTASALAWAPWGARTYYSQDNRLHFEWSRRRDGVEWWELNRVGASPAKNAVGGSMVPRDTLQRIWGEGAGPFHVSMPIQDLAAPHDAQYEISACAGALRPNDCDPASYNYYGAVQCNLSSTYGRVQPQRPLCETQTKHFRLRYHGYPSPRQISDGLDPYTTTPVPRPDSTVQYAGQTVGHCLAGGAVDTHWEGTDELVGTDSRTPLSIQKVAVWLEYLHRLLVSGPFALACLKDRRLIEVTVGEGFSAGSDDWDGPRIGLDLPTSDDELPGRCLSMLLALEVSAGHDMPNWVLPAYVSKVEIVQVARAAPPVGFADFGAALRPCEVVTAYRACWAPDSGGRALRVDVRKPLNPLRPAYAFVEFAGKAMSDETVALTLGGTDPSGQAVTIPVPLAVSADGSFYSGFLEVANGSNVEYPLDLVIRGSRALLGPVLAGLLGSRLDPAPGTPATLDPEALGAVRFTGWEDGIEDRNHRMDVGTRSRFAPSASLPADHLESNDSFAAATPVPTLVAPSTPRFGTRAVVEKTYTGLNFHRSQDIDYFDVRFECSEYDKGAEANQPASSSSSSTGVNWRHTPPELSCWVRPDDHRCMDVAAYRYATVPVLHASETRSSGIAIASPYSTLGAQRAYFLLSNHDFAHCGAFSYAAAFAYASTCDILEIDTNAQAFGAGSIRRKLLKELCERLDLPRPGDDLTAVVPIGDPDDFVKGFADFLQEPEVAALLGHNLRCNGGRVVADGCRALARVARVLGRFGDASGLYRKASAISQALGDRIGAVHALEGLADLYKLLGDRVAHGSVLDEIGAQRVRAKKTDAVSGDSR